MRLFTVVLTFLAISWVSVFAAAQDEQPLPKAKLEKADINKFEKLLKEVLGGDKDDADTRKALQSLGALVKDYEGSKKVSSALSDEEAWRNMFQRFRQSKLKRGKAAGRIVKETAIRQMGSDQLHFDYAYSLPKGYKHNGDPYPVLICLHDESKKGGYDYLKKIWDDDKVSKTLRNNFIMIAPDVGEKSSSGRKATVKRLEWFKIYHALAIMQPIKEILTKFNCDPNRMYLEGVGRGAEMVIELAALRGDINFAAVVARQGQPRNLGLVPGLRGMPILFLYREGDVMDQGDAKAYWDDLKAVAEREKIDTFTYVTVPALPSKPNPRQMALQKREPLKDQNQVVSDFLMAQTKSAYPENIRFLTNSYLFKQASVFKLPKIDLEDGATLDIDVTFDKEKNLIEANGTGFHEITFFLNDAVLDLDRPVEVRINGETAEKKMVARELSRMIETMRLQPFQTNRITTAILQVEVPAPPEKEVEKPESDKK